MRRLPGQWRPAGRPLRRVAAPTRLSTRAGPVRANVVLGTRAVRSAQDLFAVFLEPATRVESGRALKVCLLIGEEDRLGELLAGVVSVLCGEVQKGAQPDAAGGAHGVAGPSGEGSEVDRARPASSAAEPLGWGDLTPRELDVLDLVARGEDNRSIAALLRVSDRTVRNHLNSVFSKLNVSYRPQAVVVAREAGLGKGDPRFERRDSRGRG